MQTKIAVMVNPSRTRAQWVLTLQEDHRIQAQVVFDGPEGFQDALEAALKDIDRRYVRLLPVLEPWQGSYNFWVVTEDIGNPARCTQCGFSEPSCAALGCGPVAGDRGQHIDSYEDGYAGPDKF